MLLFLACADPESVADTATTALAGPWEPRFTFAILADPHVSDASANLARLQAANAWLSENAVAEDIQLVLILGDIAWYDGFPLVTDAFSVLPMPWVPILGDNEVQLGDEQTFDATFAAQYTVLSGQLDNFTRGSTPVDNPEYGVASWFQNLSFDYGEVHFAGLDWCTRHIGGIEGEMADLHDFSGGTLPWLAADLATLDEGPSDLLRTWDDAIYANFAGHYHFNGEEVDSGRPLDVYVTDAVWDDELTIRLVDVEGNGVAMRYTHRLIEL